MRQMFFDIARYQVDVICGDANATCYRYFNCQKTPSIYNGTYMTLLRKTVFAVNKIKSSWNMEQKVETVLKQWPRFIGSQTVTSNLWNTLEQCNKIGRENPNLPWKEWPELDVIMCSIISWGHDKSSSTNRKFLQSSDMPTFRKFVHDSLSSKNHGPGEFFINVDNYYMNLENQHLLLGQNDADWHSPLIVKFVSAYQGGKRKRSFEAESRRKEKYLAYLERTGKGKGK
jgi:hypothetical protein